MEKKEGRKRKEMGQYINREGREGGKRVMGNIWEGEEI